ncbi:hypothetical protein ACFX15_037201 [Malus domestica]
MQVCVVRLRSILVFFATIACVEGQSCRCPLCRATQALWLISSHCSDFVIIIFQRLRAMVFFKCFKSNTITILAKEGDSQDRGTMLKLCALLIDPKALVLPSKDNSMHIKLWSFDIS